MLLFSVLRILLNIASVGMKLMMMMMMLMILKPEFIEKWTNASREPVFVWLRTENLPLCLLQRVVRSDKRGLEIFPIKKLITVNCYNLPHISLVLNLNYDWILLMIRNLISSKWLSNQHNINTIIKSIMNE